MSTIDLDAAYKAASASPAPQQSLPRKDENGGTLTPIADTSDDSGPSANDVAMSGANLSGNADQHGFFANSEIVKGYKSYRAKGEPVDVAVLKSGADLIEHNVVANWARTMTGTTDYDATVKTQQETLDDIDSKMDSLAKAKAAGKSFDQQQWNSLVERRSFVAKLQNQTIDLASQDFMTQMIKNPSKTLSEAWSGVMGVAKSAKSDPGKAVAGFVDGFIQDPELAFAGGGASRSVLAATNVAKVSKAIKAVNTLTASAKGFGMSAAKGAGIMVPIDIMQQMNATDNVNPAQALGSAANGAIFGVTMHGLHLVIGGDAKAAAIKADPKAEPIQGQQQFTADSMANPRQAVKDVYDILGKDLPLDVKQNTEAAIEAGASVQTTIGNRTPDEIYNESVKRLAAKRAAAQKSIQEQVDGGYGVQSLASENIELKSTENEQLLDALHHEAQIPSYLGFDLANEKSITNAISFDGKPENITLETKPGSVSKQLEDLANQIRPPLKGIKVTTTKLPVQDVTLRDTAGDTRIVDTSSGEKAFLKNIVDEHGTPVGNMFGWVKPDGLHVVNAEVDPEHLGKNYGLYTYMKLADEQLAVNKILSSDDSISPAAERTYQKLKDNGYDVVKNPDAVRDPVRNRWITKDGSPVYKVLGKAADAPSVEGLQLQETADKIDNTANAIKGTGKQSGKIDLRYAAGIAGTVGGALYGYSKDHSLLTAAEYGLATDAALLGARFAPSAMRGIMYSLRTLGQEHYRLGDLGSDTNSKLNTIPLVASRMKHYINSELPDSSNLFKRLMGDKTVQLNSKEQAVHDDVRRVMNAIGGTARNLGVLKNFVDDYFTRWWKPGENASQELKDDWNAGNFRKHRTLAFGTQGMEEATAKGLVPVTDNVGEIVEAYINSMSRSIATRQFIDGVKEAVLPNGSKMVYGQDADKTPRGYVRLQGLMQGYTAHPDIAPEINFFTHFPESGMLGHAYDMVNYSMKRGTLGFSLFHPMSLFRNYVFTTGRIQDLPQAFNPDSTTLRSMKFAPAQGEDLAMRAAKSGLVFSIKSTPEDFGNDALYGPLKSLTEFANDKSLIAGTVLKGVTGAFKLNDRIAFEWNQNYYKLQTWTILRNEHVRQALNNRLKNPDKYPEPSIEQIEKDASSTVNDLFGSLNWYRIASETKSWLGRNVMLDAFNPTNRVWLQRGVLAIDWSTSVIRSFSKALGVGGKGIGENARVQAMHQRFLLGMGVAAFTVANAVNYHFSGKYIWQNDNPGYIDLGDGRKLQWDKQLAEISEWLSHPGKAALNKMAELPKEGLEAMTNKQYLSPGAGAPNIYAPDSSFATIMAKQAAHAAGKFAPIFTRQDTAEDAASSFGGLPIYPAVNKGGSISTKMQFGPPKPKSNKKF